MTDDMDARARVKRLEAENARLREALDSNRKALREAINGEGDPIMWAVSLRKADGFFVGSGIATPPNSEDDPHPTPEQVGQERDFVAGDDGYFTFSWPPQAGDALADFKFVEALAYQGASSMSFGKLHEKSANVRQALTASGVPEEIQALPEKLRNRYKPGPANDVGCAIALELEQMAKRARTAKTSDSGVPYVPEEVRRLPERLREEGEAYTATDPADCEYAAWSGGTHYAADKIESALASAPADGWKLVPVEPTQAMCDALRGRVVSDSDAACRVYAGLIAAAPQRGGDD